MDIKMFVIDKDKHFSFKVAHCIFCYLKFNLLYSLLFKKEFKRSIQIIGDNNIEDKNSPLAIQLNKITGFSFIHPHIRSARFTYNYKNKEGLFTLFSYVYNKSGTGKFISKKLITFKKGDYLDLKIKIGKNHYEFYVGNILLHKEIHNLKWYHKFLIYENYPFFGGSIKSHEKIIINIKK